MHLALIHDSPGAAPAAPGSALWQTCLRDVLFVRDVSAEAFKGRVVSDGEAYAVLLEVVCGLRSPLAGETEVQAQFKTFLSSLDPLTDRDLLRIGQRVLADAKSIRQRHLQGVGVVTYGPLVARFVPSGRRVALIGTGALASDLVAALCDRHQIDRWGRRPTNQRERCFLLSDAASRPVWTTEAVTLIVAAPVPQVGIDALSACYPRIPEIIDLRGRHDRQPPSTDSDCRIMTLEDLFHDASELGAGADRIAAARRDIRERSQAFVARDQQRPFGWDDLWA